MWISASRWCASMAASRPAAAGPPISLAMMRRRKPASSITEAWRISATVVPQAPASIRRAARTGDIGVLPCGAMATPWLST